jgi:murein DD-endopeptidase MepM/ murein hydrolase activator NlpD
MSRYYDLLKEFGYRETQGFGRSAFAIRSGIYPQNFHDGRDYTYTNIRNNACKVLMGGKITYVGFGGRWGNAYGYLVEIEVAPNTFMVYAHLDRFLPLAKVGEVRKVGDDIGIIGKSGTSRSTGIHVHLLVRQLGQRVDPKEYIDFRYTQDNKPAQTINKPNNNEDMTDKEIKVMLTAIARQYNKGDIFDPKKGAWIDIDHYVTMYKNTPQKDLVIDRLYANIDDIKVKQGINLLDARTRNWRK